MCSILGIAAKGCCAWPSATRTIPSRDDDDDDNVDDDDEEEEDVDDDDVDDDDVDDDDVDGWVGGRVCASRSKLAAGVAREGSAP